MGRPNQRYLQRREEQLQVEAAHRRSRQRERQLFEHMVIAQAQGIAAGLQQALQSSGVAPASPTGSTH